MTPFTLWICSLLLSSSFAWALPVWNRPNLTASSQYRTAVPHPAQDGAILIAGDQQVFVASGDTLPKELWRTSNTQTAIHRLLHFEALPNQLFVLTPQTLYAGDLKTGAWQRLYHLSAGKNSEILHAFSVIPGQSSQWLLGTSERLLASQDQGKTWAPIPGLNHAAAFSLIHFAGASLFVAAGDTLYRSDDLFSFRPVFELSASTDFESSETLPDDASNFESDTAPAQAATALTALLSSGETCSQLWLGTSSGVLSSPDCGASWETLPNNGLRSTQIDFLAYAPNSQRLFAGTSSGIYILEPQQKIWRELYQGLSDTQPRALFVLPGETETLVTVTQDGILRFPVSPLEVPEAQAFDAGRLELFQMLLRAEPDARATQRAVIRYANVPNQKIKRWQWQSRVRALLPSFSFGRDFGKSNNLDIDRGSTSDRDFYISGPEDWSRGWDWDVTWGLDDLIWSSNQTSIDSREKLMVDLRHDLLGEVTRIFYERRRLQMETALLPSANAAEYFGKLLRLEELTALLDAMTDGFFSQRVRAVYATNPEFATLWEYEEA